MSDYQITNFNGGEVSGLMRGNVDNPQYKNSCRTIKNFMVMAFGGLVKRPGTEITDRITATGKVRLEHFYDAYMIEFTDYKARLMQYGKYVTNTNGEYFEVDTPLPEIMLDELSIKNFENRMYVAHKMINIQTIEVLSEELVIASVDQPNTMSVEIDWSTATVGAGTTTNTYLITLPKASVPTGFQAEFETTIVGKNAQFQLTHTRATSITIPGTWARNDYDEGDMHPQTTPITNPVINIDEYHFITKSRGSKAMAWVWSFPADKKVISVWAEITNPVIDGATNYVFEINKSAWDMSEQYHPDLYGDLSNFMLSPNFDLNYTYMDITTETKNALGNNWYFLRDEYMGSGIKIRDIGNIEDMYSVSSATIVTTNGIKFNPGIIEFHENRMIAANGRVIRGSAVGDFTKWDTESITDASDPWIATFAGETGGEVVWIISARELIIGTGNGPWKFLQNGEPLGATSLFMPRRQSAYRCHKTHAVFLGDVIAYLQNPGDRLRVMFYQEARDQYTSQDLNMMSPHLFRNDPVKQMVFQQSPYPILWCLTDSGKLATLTFDLVNNVIAWSTQEIAGVVHTMEKYIDYGREVIVLLVEYLGVRRYVRLDFNNTFHMDYQSSFTGTLTAGTIIPFSEYPGQTVHVFEDFTYRGDFTLDNDGNYEVIEDCNVVTIGYSFESEVEPMPFPYLPHKRKRTHHVGLILENASMGQIGDGETMTEIRYDDSNLNFSGTVRATVDNGIEKEDHLVIRHDYPSPFTLLSIAYDTLVGEV